MFMLKSALAALAFSTRLLAAYPTDQDRPDSPNVIQFVLDSRKAGLDDRQIQEAAAKAGWPASSVADAIAQVPAATTAGKPVPAASPAGWEVGSTPTSPLDIALPAVPIPPRPAKSAGAKAATKVDHGVSDDYRIGEGDVLQVNVYEEPTASVEKVVVRPDGKVSLPLIKEVPAAGLTPLQLEKVLAEQLSKMIKLPDVTVVVSEVNSKKIFITGAVKREEPISYNYRMTVMQALSEAGGLTDYAKRKKIYVLRQDNGRQYQFPFDFDAVMKGQRMELNILLEPGDTIVVPH